MRATLSILSIVASWIFPMPLEWSITLIVLASLTLLHWLLYYGFAAAKD